MNLVYMHTHDSGRYFEPYGYSVKSPNILRFAGESTVFRNAFCAAPTCSPSRAAMLTGMSAHESGMLGLVHRGFSLSRPETHLAQYLRKNGYETALSGVQHEATDAKTLGYEHLLSPANEKSLERRERDLENARRSAAFIAGAQDKPFFLSFGMSNTHRPYPEYDPEIADPSYVRPPWPVQDNDENRRDMAAYMTAVKTVDDCVGIVLNALRASDHMKDTIVVFTTDHGLPWPEMKCTLTDQGTGVALMISYPGNPLAGKITDALTSQIDLYPTLLMLMNLEIPDWLEGQSLLPVFEEQKEVNTYIFSEVSYHASCELMRSVRDRRYKLIVRFDDCLYPACANMDASPAKEMLLKNGYAERNRSEKALYDLLIDPAERINLYEEPSLSDICKKMESTLHEWMLITHDPLLAPEGLPFPEGAKITPRTHTDAGSGIFETRQDRRNA